jgi:transglutaminase superfamily protein
MVVKRFIGVAIVLFWCLMNVLLVKRQFWARPALITVRSSEKITERIEEWWGIFYRGEKIGYAQQTITPSSTGYTLQDQSNLRLQLLGKTQDVSTRADTEVDQEWMIERFDFQLTSADVNFRARGKVRPGYLDLEIDSAGYISEKTIALHQRPYLLAALKPYVVTQQLEPKKQHYFSTFDPATLSQQVTTITIEGRENLRLGAGVEPAIRIRQQFKGISVTSWLDGSGRTLKEESPAGFSLVRQSAQEARSLADRRSVPLDLIAQTSITPSSPIANPGRAQRLKLRLSGVDLGRFSLNGGRQRLENDELEIRREEIRSDRLPIPVRDPRLRSYLEATPFMQSDHPRIRGLAQHIVAGETDGLKAALRIKDWVYGQLTKEPTVSIPNALEVLRTKKGDCNEHTVLFNALARAAGIPARTAVGVVYVRGAFYYHAWSEVWLGEWVTLDSVLNQFPADVTHVKFVEGEIDRQIDILQLIGNLKINVIEAS